MWRGEGVCLHSPLQPQRPKQMAEHVLHIRNMVCDRCKAAVRSLLERQDVVYSGVELGEARIEAAPTPDERERLANGLAALGFELIDDKRARTVERIKQLLLALVKGDAQQRTRQKLSSWLASEMHAEYSGLSKLFSEVEGTTIERYHNLLRIERAKELLVYDEMSVAQIADQLGYSSAQHLSNQFAQYEGHSPSHFKRIGTERRRALDRVGKKEPLHERNT